MHSSFAASLAAGSACHFVWLFALCIFVERIAPFPPSVCGSKELRVSFLLPYSFGPGRPSPEHCGRKGKKKQQRKVYLHISVECRRKLHRMIMHTGIFLRFEMYRSYSNFLGCILKDCNTMTFCICTRLVF